IEVRYGKLNASSDEVHIDVFGKGSHGAYPENGIDALLIASHLVLSLQSLVSRTISPLNSAVLTFGKIQGGTAQNIICDHVSLSGTLRTLDPQTRAAAKQYIRTQADAICAAYGGRAEVLFHSGYDALINDPDMVDLVVENASQLIGKENIFWKDAPSLGVEDFSFFQESAKAGVFYHLGCTAPNQQEIHPLHTAEFELDEACLKTGILLQYTLARKLLCYSGSDNRMDA
ncbi:MAG: M20 family metallopeptidase, partial [Muricoprocola sp.]